jgi:acyl carrier protein
MRRGELERHLLDFVNRTLLGSDPARTAHEDTALFEEGIVTSLRILDLIAFVEKETRTKVPDEAVRLANFRSVRAIAAAFGEDGKVAGAEGRAAPIAPFERRAGRTFATPIAELEARGELELMAPGRAVFRGAPLELLRHFDSIALGWAEDLDALEPSYPEHLPRETLRRAGYTGNSAPGDAIVPPAVCYHVYAAWEGKRLGDRPILLTARGRCYRSEPGQSFSLERLREFEMREIVMLGPRDDVERFRQRLMEKVSDLVRALDLEGRVEKASDPFFLGTAEAPVSLEGLPDARGRRLMQQVLPLKYELRLVLDETGRTCAVASFNHHLDFFGRRFDIRLASEDSAHSGCVAFGLERWVLAFLSQHGTDERNWPDPVRDLGARKEEHEPRA